MKYPKAFDVQMFYGEGKLEYNSTLKSISPMEHFNKGCIFDQRRLKIEDSFQMTLPEDSTYIYTDMLIVGYNAYLVRNDHKIYKIEIQFN